MQRSKDWLRQAERDLEHAKADMNAGYYDWACFSAQQSAEKATKAVFENLGIEVWGHSISDLLVLLKKHYQVNEELIEIASELDKAYILTRYPNVLPAGAPTDKYTKNEAQRLIGYAEKIYNFCKNILSKT